MTEQQDKMMKQDTVASDPEFIHDQMLGKLALSYNLIDIHRYMEAVEIQKKDWAEGRKTLLSDLFIKYGFLSDERIHFLNQAKEIITKKRKEKRFGVIAVKKGFISDEQLAAALRIQRSDKREIGMILIELEYISEAEKEQILEIQKNMVIKIPTFEEIAQLAEGQKHSPKSNMDFMTLNVSSDALLAVLTIHEHAHDVTSGEILDFLKIKGICYGIVDMDTIETFLKCRELGMNGFIAAQGQKSVPPVTGETVYHFTPRPLVAEIVTELIPPSVVAGSVIAERKIIRKAVPRITVYGIAIEENEKTDNQPFLHGNGARMNDERSMITAAWDGEPFIHPDGTISVLKDHSYLEIIEQDEPLSIEGNVRVEGLIGNNMEIRAANIKANRVDGAVLTADGDVWINEDLLDSTVVAAGTVRADSITNCRISSIGDVVSGTDIESSHVETLGACQTGKDVVASKITATKGVIAQNIIPKNDTPCMIEFGKATMPGTIAKVNSKIEGIERNISGLVDQIQAVESMVQITRQIIQDIMRDMTKTENEQTMLLNTVTRMEQKSNRRVITGRDKIDAMAVEIKAARDVLKNLTDDVYQLQRNSGGLKKTLQIKMKELKETKNQVNREIDIMTKKLAARPGRQEAEIRGMISKGSIVKGPHTMFVLGQDMENSVFRETRVPGSDGKSHDAYTIAVHGLDKSMS